MIVLGPPSTVAVAVHDLDRQENESSEVVDAKTVLGLSANGQGTMLACVGQSHVVILRVKEELDWTPVGWCSRPFTRPKTEKRVEIAWSTDSTRLVVCNADGVAEFYDLSYEGPSEHGVRLSLPSWIVGKKTEKRSGRLFNLKYVCSINSTVDGDQVALFSAVAIRMWLLMGTGHGTIVRVLWTGEIVMEKEVDLFPEPTPGKTQALRPERSAVVKISVGYQQRVGFVTKGGACGVLIRNKGEDETQSICYLAEENIVSIAVHQVKPFVAIGLQNGTILISVVGKSGGRVMREITFPQHEIPVSVTDRLAALKKIVRDDYVAAATVVQWCPDGSDFVAVGYNDVGYMIWSASGTLVFMTCVSLLKKRSFDNIGAERYLPSLTWSVQGYNLLTKALEPDSDAEKNGIVLLSSLELVKSCALCGNVVSGSTSMCMQGWNYLMVVQNQDWDVKSLSWQRIDLPPVYIQANWPVRHVAVSLNGNFLAVAGTNGVAVFSKTTKRWKLFEDILHEKSISCKMVFWWGDDVLCLVVRESRTRSWELLALSKDRLDLSHILGQTSLHARPLAVDTLFSENVVVFQMSNHLALYHLRLFHSTPGKPTTPPWSVQEDSASASEGEDDAFSSGGGREVWEDRKGTSEKRKLAERKHSQYIIRRASSASVITPLSPVDGIFIRHLESVSLQLSKEDNQYPSSMCLMPCGATRRAGSSVKFPKCVVLLCDGTVNLIDLDEGTKTTIARGVNQIIPQSWSKIDQADDIVLESFIEISVQMGNQSRSNVDVEDGSSLKQPKAPRATSVLPKLPSVLLYTIWILDKRGMRLWLPALDIGGEFTSTICTDSFSDILPVGVLESHGLLIGVAQRSRTITKQHIPCFEISLRVTPTTHAMLSWLVRTDRVELAAQVILQASTHLPLFQETLDLFLFNTVELDYTNGKVANVLPRAIKLLRTGKITAIIDPRTYDSLVVSCARKMESSRWPLFFSCAASPEQLFNDAIYNGDLQTAAGSMIIADFFSPTKSTKRIAALAHAAALKKDDRLLEQIKRFQKTKLI